MTLFAIPKTHLSNLTITTKNSGEVSVDTKIANGDKNTTVSHVILDAKGKTLQTFEHKFGFRELTIDGKILKLNGQPIKLRGVTCHSTDPKTAKVISDELTLKDMRLMKEASINYKKASGDELREYFAKVLPNFDRERVHVSDIKKLIQWYNILVNNGVTDFENEMQPTPGDNIDDRQEA